jgi:hypothetical protein
VLRYGHPATKEAAITALQGALSRQAQEKPAQAAKSYSEFLIPALENDPRQPAAMAAFSSILHDLAETDTKEAVSTLGSALYHTKESPALKAALVPLVAEILEARLKDSPSEAAYSAKSTLEHHGSESRVIAATCRDVFERAVRSLIVTDPLAAIRVTHHMTEYGKDRTLLAFAAEAKTQAQAQMPAREPMTASAFVLRMES